MPRTAHADAELQLLRDRHARICLCLIDAGIGNDKERPDRPRLASGARATSCERLQALGYAPERFDLVINTHLHADHVGWNTIA